MEGGIKFNTSKSKSTICVTYGIDIISLESLQRNV